LSLVLPADAGFSCDTLNVPGDTIKRTLVIAYIKSVFVMVKAQIDFPLLLALIFLQSEGSNKTHRLFFSMYVLLSF